MKADKVSRDLDYGTAPSTVAAIDCGTNSIRLLISRQPTEAARPGERPADATGTTGVDHLTERPADATGTTGVDHRTERPADPVPRQSGMDRSSTGTGESATASRPPSWQIDRPADVVRLMRIVRLGEGIDSTGRISAAALDRTATALREYATLITEHRPRAVRMVATSASRDADNSREFRDLVHDILGVMPEVISGDEEARLSFAGAVADLPPAASPRLVVDIGGGSTEFVLGTGQAGPARSVDIGCVRMTERHLRGDPPTAEQIAAAEADITARVDEALAVVDPNRAATELVGLAGSVTTVAALALGLDEYLPQRIHHAEIGYDEVAKVTAMLLGQSREQRLSHGVMHPGRADVIGGGALVLRVIMERTGARTVLASEHDILDGIAASIG